MFKRLPEAEGRPVSFTIDGAAAVGREGESIAAALLCNGRAVCRSSAVSGAPRGPYCMMGVCFDCLVEMDGVPNRQACLVPVVEGRVPVVMHANLARDIRAALEFAENKAVPPFAWGFGTLENAHEIGQPGEHGPRQHVEREVRAEEDAGQPDHEDIGDQRAAQRRQPVAERERSAHSRAVGDGPARAREEVPDRQDPTQR